MYERDTAHAVDLRALRFRPDGLLFSATRYPRHSDENWSEEATARGWYNYETKLIDCRTGFFVALDEQLLDREGRPIERREIPLAQQRQRLIDALDPYRQRRWPDNSETLLACAAASDPTLRVRRERAARAPMPLISYEPATQRYMSDSWALLERVMKPIDLETMKRAKIRTSTELFSHIRRQAVAWRTRFDSTYEPETLSQTALEQIQARALELVHGPKPHVRVIESDVIELASEWTTLWGDEDRPKAAAAARLHATIALTDCSVQVTVPIQRIWLDLHGAVLFARPIAVAQARADVLRQLEGREDAPSVYTGSGPNESDFVSEACQVLAVAKRRASAGTNDASDANDNRLAFGLTRDDINTADTAEAALLRVRTLARSSSPETSSSPPMPPR